MGTNKNKAPLGFSGGAFFILGDKYSWVIESRIEVATKKFHLNN